MDTTKTRTRFDIFPVMQTFKWKLSISNSGLNTTRSTDAHLFLHRSLRSLNITICDDLPGETISQIVGDIPIRSPDLVSLTIRTGLSTNSIEREISYLLPKLPKLELVA